MDTAKRRMLKVQRVIATKAASTGGKAMFGFAGQAPEHGSDTTQGRTAHRLRVVPCPRITVFLREDPRDRSAIVARAQGGLVHRGCIRRAVGLGVAVARVPSAAAVRVVPAGLHEAVFLAKVGVWAVARPCVRAGGGLARLPCTWCQLMSLRQRGERAAAVRGARPPCPPGRAEGARRRYFCGTWPRGCGAYGERTS